MGGYSHGRWLAQLGIGYIASNQFMHKIVV
jgi:hypothetical protein